MHVWSAPVTQAAGPATTRVKTPASNRDHALPPNHEEYQKFQREIAKLSALYGRDLLRAEINRRPEPRSVGRPRKWSRIHLFSLWMIVQTLAKIKNDNIEQACTDLERAGGIVKLSDKHGTLIEQPMAFTKGRIRRLYYEADKEFDKFELDVAKRNRKIVQHYTSLLNDAGQSWEDIGTEPSDLELSPEARSSTLKESLLSTTEYWVSVKDAFEPVIDDVIYFVHYQFFQRGMACCPPVHPADYLLLDQS
jgi:hypothetical protein